MCGHFPLRNGLIDELGAWWKPALSEPGGSQIGITAVARRGRSGRPSVVTYL
jgi:hypothetical protein